MRRRRSTRAGADDADRTAVDDASVEHRGSHILVIEQCLKRPDVSARLGQVGRDALAEREACRALGEPRRACGIVHCRFRLVPMVEDLFFSRWIDARARGGKQALPSESMRFFSTRRATPAYDGSTYRFDEGHMGGAMYVKPVRRPRIDLYRRGPDASCDSREILERELAARGSSPPHESCANKASSHSKTYHREHAFSQQWHVPGDAQIARQRSRPIRENMSTLPSPTTNHAQKHKKNRTPRFATCTRNCIGTSSTKADSNINQTAPTNTA